MVERLESASKHRVVYWELVLNDPVGIISHQLRGFTTATWKTAQMMRRLYLRGSYEPKCSI